MAEQGLSRQIAETIAAVRYEDLPPAVVHATKRSLLDAIGVMLAGSGLTPACRPFADLAVASGEGLCTLIGRAGTATPAAAALANGALAHAIDFEDGHDGAPVHPNAVQIPAALAWAEAAGGVDGRALITALAVGCDLVCRMGISLAADPARFGWYPPPMLGAYGAVAACARLAGLEPARIVDAFSLLLCSSVTSAEIKYSPLSDMRAVRDAFPAQAALQAVQLAERGVTGFAAPLEGKAGFFALYGRGDYDAARLLDGLGTRFEGENLTFKLWPSCRGTHAGIESALALAAGRPGLVDAIESITLSGHPVMTMLDEPRAAKRAPATAIDAKFSLPFTVATALLRGDVTLDSFAPEALVAPDVLALADKVRFRVLADAAPGAIASGGITIRLKDGEELERFVASPRGAPGNPVSQEELVAKFRACARLAEVPPDEAMIEAIVARIDRLEEMADVRDLLSPP